MNDDEFITLITLVPLVLTKNMDLVKERQMMTTKKKKKTTNDDDDDMIRSNILLPFCDTPMHNVNRRTL